MGNDRKSFQDREKAPLTVTDPVTGQVLKTIPKYASILPPAEQQPEQEEQNSPQDEAAYRDIEEQLNPTRRGSPEAQEARDVFTMQRLRALAENGDMNSPRQQQEMAQSLGSQGVGQRMQQYLQDSPQGTNQQRMLDLMKQMDESNHQDILKQYQDPSEEDIGSFKDQLERTKKDNETRDQVRQQFQQENGRQPSPDEHENMMQEIYKNTSNDKEDEE
jgi:hypothetical protein